MATLTRPAEMIDSTLEAIVEGSSLEAMILEVFWIGDE